MATSMPIHVEARDSRDSIALYTAAIGGLYGVGESLVNGNDPIKGCWDGFMTGSMLPGAILGGGIGLGVGFLVNSSMLTPMTEKSWVGWGSGGAAIGSLLSTHSVASTLERQMDMPFPILSTGLFA